MVINGNLDRWLITDSLSVTSRIFWGYLITSPFLVDPFKDNPEVIKKYCAEVVGIDGNCWLNLENV